jgi:hypothetical protein
VKFRADIRIITDYRTIIVEVDEYQHDTEEYGKCIQAKISNILASEVADSLSKTRMSVDERIQDRRERVKLNSDFRMNEIASSGDVQPIVFIRFNPDTWTDEEGVMHKRKKEIPEERLSTLEEEIDRWLDIEKTQEHFAQVVYLYYNGPERMEDYIPMDPSELEEEPYEFGFVKPVLPIDEVVQEEPRLKKNKVE